MSTPSLDPPPPREIVGAGGDRVRRPGILGPSHPGGRRRRGDPRRRPTRFPQARRRLCCSMCGWMCRCCGS